MKHFISVVGCLIMLIPSLRILSQTCETVIWNDEFDTNGLPDSTKWGYDIGDGCNIGLCGWGNNELQYYTEADTNNARVENGKLIIEVKKEDSYGKDYTSARLVTREKFEKTYGRFEMSAKLPSGAGVWAAFWLLGDPDIYGPWPNRGELDIMEYVGADTGVVFGTAHAKANLSIQKKIKSDDVENAFHIYAIEWNEDTIKWFFDDSIYHKFIRDPEFDPSWKQWPFDQPFHIILNIAMGGALGGEVDDSIFADGVRMEIDYVRVVDKISRTSIIGNDNPVAGESSVNYHFPKEDALSYKWSVPEGTSVLSGDSSPSILIDWGCADGDIVLEINTTECGIDTVSLPVVFEKITIDGVREAFEMDTGLLFTVPDLLGGVYNWSVPEGVNIISGNSTNRIYVDWGCSEGEIILEAASSCETVIRDTLLVRLHKYYIYGPSIVPPYGEQKTYRIDAIEGATYSWTVPDDAAILTGANTNDISVNFGTESGMVSVDVVTNCGLIKYDLFVTISNLLTDFESVSLDFEGFVGSEFEISDNPDPSGINTSSRVGKTWKGPGSATWSGIFADMGYELDFSVNPSFIMKVYGESPGTILFKIEDQIPGNEAPIEIPVQLTEAHVWQELFFDFSGTPTAYDRIVLFFDFGNINPDYYYFDDISLTYNLQNSEWGLADDYFDGFNIYPNPTEDLLKLKTEQQGYYLIEIISLNGQLIFSGEMDGTSHQIDLSSFQKGVYLITIRSKDFVTTRKIIKL